MNTARPPLETTKAPAPIPASRWISWLAIAGFTLGLCVMFFISGIFGIPAPLGWAFIVLILTMGFLLLDRPRLLLSLMMFYFLLMPNDRLFGILPIPLPSFVDELFFLPFIAVITMNWIQQRKVKETTIFPVLFIIIAGVSWYLNGRSETFTAVQVTLVMLKPYIIWYYCRLTCTFENERQLARWMWLIIGYAAIQYVYNIYWQQGLWPRFHPDISWGVFGTMGAAHIVGYLSVFALFLLAGWWVSVGRNATTRRKAGVIFLALVIGYDLVFMTDTKHGLLFAPIAFLPFLFHPAVSHRLRISMLVMGGVFVLATMSYFIMFSGRVNLVHHWHQMVYSPKGEIFRAVTKDFHHLVPYPLFGAGPGRFSSGQAVRNRAPLARRYVLPYSEEERRVRLAHGGSSRTGSSQLAWPQSDFLTLAGEFGWLGVAAYFGFLGWVIWKLFVKAYITKSLIMGGALALSSCFIFLGIVILFIQAVTTPVLAFPLWMLAGRIWDMKEPADKNVKLST